jgi:hypothetical protein
MLNSPFTSQIRISGRLSPKDRKDRLLVNLPEGNGSSPKASQHPEPTSICETHGAEEGRPGEDLANIFAAFVLVSSAGPLRQRSWSSD